MQRRTFMTLVAGSAALVGAGCAFGLGRYASRALGIQLYSLRRVMAEAPERTLAALAEIGYTEVELAGHYGRSARELRAMLDANGLRAPATHVSLQQLRGEWGRTAEDAHTLGHTYIVVPSTDGRLRTPDGYHHVAAELNAAGEAARALGMRVGYHNHDYELRPVDGVVPLDLLLAETDAALVDFELDLYWTVRAGADPHAYFVRWPGRFPLVHVKDMAAGGDMVDVGAGSIDFARIIAAQEQAGIRHYIVEHDNPADPLAFARASHAHLAGLFERTGGAATR